MTPQSTFMIVANVREGQVENLRKLLASMNSSIGQADGDNKLLPFSQFIDLHVARFVILEARTAEEISVYGLTPRPWQPALVFLGDCDGDSNSFLAQLTAKSSTGLKQIFSFCEGFCEQTLSKQRSDLLSWLQAHNVQPDANYINTLGRTVVQLHEEAALHRSLADYLQTIAADVGRENTRDLRQKLLSHIELEKHAGRLSLTPPAATPSRWKMANLLHKMGIPLILLLLSPLLLLAAPFLAWRLRVLEKSDPEILSQPEQQQVRELSVQEDRYVTNQFNVFGDIKPGIMRLFLLKSALLLLDYAVRHIYNHGFLTRVKTIHFARWVLLDNNRRLFFASNYDGSLESYMDDFINKVAWGLNLVFSNGVGYPSTRWLIKGGAEHEQKFKHMLRRHQLPSEVWYKAYPDLTAYELLRNSRIRQGVEIRQSSDAQIRAWLSLI